MAEWVPIQDGRLIAADVIRWKENVYGPRRSRKAKAARLGVRLVTAEVLKEPDTQGWMQLLVLKCDILKVMSVRTPPEFSSNMTIKRALKTIMRGNPERMLWSDESARDAVIIRSAT
ncbi:MAG: hypothetical protein IH606_16725 [Burkholderiales bacterium]|nr:hypothetical protein [Burkholderiales bacterium]